ncbi:MAG: Holliday junction branch migration protein RuvA [Bacteroidales bacterium]|nr:Holliday junction branch migration protein RuvA [Bacteroidales bacterium]HRX30886.1 Holliday junction branch migration protein RuvA [Tenuifilaceae bacterium]
MFEYISGNLTDLTPAYAVVDINGLGYHVNISLNTFTELEGKGEVKLYLHHVVREDAELLFGFATIQERNLFRLLISVSGVGANTARLILSSLTVDELKAAIATENVTVIKQVKGIGLKTAQRLVVDLKDKVIAIGEIPNQIIGQINNTSLNEALSALVMLGFARSAAEKVLSQIAKKEGDVSVETLIKLALKQL